MLINVYDLFQLELNANKCIRKSIVIGDSRQVIQKMRHGYVKGKNRCKRIFKRISLINDIGEIMYPHLLWDNNEVVGNLANKGAKLN